MKFDYIKISNLFSYFGEIEFDLRGAKRGCNVVLISGGNGYGKTSFINCVKLLFHGASEDLKQSVQLGRTLKETDYFLGTGNEWQGVFNRQARLDGINEYFVELGLSEPSNKVVVRRQWYIETESKISSDLSVESMTPEKWRKEGEDAQVFLDERIPIDFAPFFFFDGEQIQRLAEANRQAQLEQIERFLGISRIERLREYVGRTANEWRKQGMEGDAKYALTILEKELAVIAASADTLQQEQAQKKEEIDEIQRQITANRRYLESMRAYSRQFNERKIRDDIKRMKDDLDRESSLFSESFPVQSFLLTNTKLVEQTILKIKETMSQGAPNQLNTLAELLRDLPRDLFERGRSSEPPLVASQKDFYKDKLDRWVATYLESNDEKKKGLSIPTGATEPILRELYQASDKVERKSRFIDQIRKITGLKRDLKELERQLDDVSSFSVEEQTLFLQRKSENDERESKIVELVLAKTEVERRYRDEMSNLEEKEKALADQRQKVRLGQHLQRQVDLATKVQRFLQDYKHELKAARRAAIERQLNTRFKQLLTSNRLVQSIQIGEDFDLHYLDKAGNEVGMANLSAGMKQIAAMALLWALGDVSQREVPLVIDTPLARIDLENQENILTKYYPKVGRQVIVLPTNSEIDRSKYKLLAPYIYREYQLRNVDGDKTEPHASTMY